jgi:hypothetical protein
MEQGGKDQGIGDRFQQELKYQRGKLPAWQLDWARKPGTYKRYPADVRKVQAVSRDTDGAAG